MQGRFSKEIMNWMGGLFLIALIALGATGQWAPNKQESTAVFSLTDGGSAPLIVIDAGHGGSDGGAVGVDTNIQESGLNLKVAKLVESGLREAGFSVVMTREDDGAIGTTKNADMKKRRDIMRRDGVNAVVSIHMNKFSDRSIRGPMAFYMKGSAQGELLATAVIQNVCLSIGNPQRPANPGDYYVIRESIAPAVIIECGFLSNPGDEALLQDAAHQQKLADGIVAGIAAYFNAAPAPAGDIVPSSSPSA